MTFSIGTRLIILNCIGLGRLPVGHAHMNKVGFMKICLSGIPTSKPRNPLVPASILKKAGKHKDKKKATKDQPIKGE